MTRSPLPGALLVLVLAAPCVADEIRGVLVRVDREKNEIHIEGQGIGRRGVSMTLPLAKDAKIQLGEGGELGRMGPGQRVRVVVDPGRRVVVEVQLAGLLKRKRPAPAPMAPKPAVPGGSGLTGVLQRVAYTEREIVLIGPGADGPQTETTLAVPKNVRVVKDGKDVPFEQLTDGVTATVQAKKRDGKMTATMIQVGDAPPPSAPEEADNARFPRLRRLLELAGPVLEEMERMREKKP